MAYAYTSSIWVVRDRRITVSSRSEPTLVSSIQDYTERHYIKDKKNKQNTKTNSTGYEDTLSPSIQEAKKE